MKLKKAMVSLLMLAMSTVLFAGCGTAKEENGAVNAGDGSAEGGSNEVVEFTFYNQDGKADPWTDPVALAITEKTGVKLKTDYPVTSDDKKVALMLADQKYPDLIFAKGDVSQLIEIGAMVDMSDLIEEYGPNIKKLYGDEYDKLRFSKDDPAIYQLSAYSVNEQYFESSGTCQIQFDVLKANDWKVPYTLEEYEKMIKDYLAENPTTEDGMERIGITIDSANWYNSLGNPAGFIAEGAPDNGQWLIDEEYNVVYKFRSEKIREYFKWLNRMYAEGILDSEFATQTHEDYIAKIASGRVIALTDAGWNYRDGEKVLKQDGKMGASYAGLPVTIDENTKCTSLMYTGLTTGMGVGITTDCKDPVKAIKFLDFLCSDEGQVLTYWGIEGINYTIDEHGQRVRSQEEINAAINDSEYGNRTGIGLHGYPFPSYGPGVMDETGSPYRAGGSKEDVIAAYNDMQKEACKGMGVDALTDIFPARDEFETPKYSAVWAYTKPVEFDEIVKQLDEIAWPGLIKSITCPETEFDKVYGEMLTELEKCGMAEAEEILSRIVKDKVAQVTD